MPVCSPGTEQACPLGLAASHHATIGGVRGENRRIGYRRGQSTKLKKGSRLQYTSNLSFRWDRGGSEGRFTRSKRVFTPVLCPVKIELFLF